MKNSTSILQKWFAFPISTRLPLIATYLLSLLLIGVFVTGCSDSNVTGSDNNGDGTKQEDITNQTTTHSTVNLRSAGDFVILAGGEITNVPTSSITGDLGISPAAGSSYTGFSLTYTTGDQYALSAQVTGRLYASDYGSPTPANLTTAKGDLTTAYNDAAGRTATDIVIVAGNLGGLTLTPGLYKSTGSLEISSGDLTFDANGNANAVFIIQIASTLTTGSDRKIILSGGAKAANIFWQVGTSASLGTTSVFKGNIMADQAITLATGASVEGRLLARIAAVTLEGNTIVKPSM
ncbi:MAG: ice-binding family protein [Balneolales bacterium]